MCKDCGCSSPGNHSEGPAAHDHPDSDGHTHVHGHSHHHHTHGASEHQHEAAQPEQTHSRETNRRTIEVRRAMLEKNDRFAERNRGLFQGHGLLVLNVLSAPGSGKTAFLTETIRQLSKDLRAGVIVGDLATDNDAKRLEETGAPVVQITTGTMCHLEAEMVGRAARKIELNALEILFIENVGNLVCPASYDLGEDLRVVLISVTEGEDKPLKYPPMFQAADIVIITKADLTAATGSNQNLLYENLRKVCPRAEVFTVSSRTSEGFGPWVDFLRREHIANRAKLQS